MFTDDEIRFLRLLATAKKRKSFYPWQAWRLCFEPESTHWGKSDDRDNMGRAMIARINKKVPDLIIDSTKEWTYKLNLSLLLEHFLIDKREQPVDYIECLEKAGMI